jgi:hypothetical protein
MRSGRRRTMVVGPFVLPGCCVFARLLRGSRSAGSPYRMRHELSSVAAFSHVAISARAGPPLVDAKPLPRSVSRVRQSPRGVLTVSAALPPWLRQSPPHVDARYSRCTKLARRVSRNAAPISGVAVLTLMPRWIVGGPASDRRPRRKSDTPARRASPVDFRRFRCWKRAVFYPNPKASPATAPDD